MSLKKEKKVRKGKNNVKGKEKEKEKKRERKQTKKGMQRMDGKHFQKVKIVINMIIWIMKIIIELGERRDII